MQVFAELMVNSVNHLKNATKVMIMTGVIISVRQGGCPLGDQQCASG